MKIGILEFRNQNFEDLFKDGIWKINKIIMIKQINVKNRILEIGN